MGEQLYKKTGRKYEPVNDPIAYDGLTEGTYLVTVKPGSKTIRTLLNPKYAELDASLEHLKDELIHAIRKESELKPSSVKMSEKEQKAWKAFHRIMGNDKIRWFAHFESYDKIASAGCEKVRQIMLNNNCDSKKIKKKYNKKKIDINNNLCGIDID